MAILTLGLATGLLLAQPSIDSAIEDLRDAREGMFQEMSSMRNTDFEISSASFNNTTSYLNLTVRNTGSNILRINEMDMLVNGTYLLVVDVESTYIYPGQEQPFSLTNITDPRSIKLIGPWGISCTTNTIETA